jgi:hypothetical protein
MAKKPAYLWDYQLSEEEFQKILEGKLTKGRLDRDWAVVRLLEYASYPEIIKLLGYREIVNEWPRLRTRIRAQSRRRGFDFLVTWLPKHHPEWLDQAHS